MFIHIIYPFLYIRTDISGFRTQAALTWNMMPLATQLKITIFSVIYPSFLDLPMFFLSLIVYVNTYLTYVLHVICLYLLRSECTPTKKNVFQWAANKLTSAAGVGIHTSWPVQESLKESMQKCAYHYHSIIY